MPTHEIPDKLFFKISEVCTIVGVEAYVLRFWETEFPTLAPEKSKTGHRVYKRKDVENFLKVKELLYDRGCRMFSPTNDVRVMIAGLNAVKSDFQKLFTEGAK